MTLSLKFILETSEQDNVRLLETMRKDNEACDFVAGKVFSLKLINKCKLQRIVCTAIRERFGLTIIKRISPQCY